MNSPDSSGPIDWTNPPICFTADVRNGTIGLTAVSSVAITVVPSLENCAATDGILSATMAPSPATMPTPPTAPSAGMVAIRDEMPPTIADFLPPRNVCTNELPKHAAVRRARLRRAALAEDAAAVDLRPQAVHPAQERPGEAAPRPVALRLALVAQVPHRRVHGGQLRQRPRRARHVDLRARDLLGHGVQLRLQVGQLHVRVGVVDVHAGLGDLLVQLLQPRLKGGQVGLGAVVGLDLVPRRSWLR